MLNLHGAYYVCAFPQSVLNFFQGLQEFKDDVTCDKYSTYATVLTYTYSEHVYI